MNVRSGSLSKLLPGLLGAVMACLLTPAPVPAAINCRGLGLEKVRVGEEHCGLISRERKMAALESACTLAEPNREELLARAKSRAQNKCSEPANNDEYRCTGELRRWENIFTHVLSVKCWAECGLAYLIDCEKVEPGGDGDGDGGPVDEQLERRSSQSPAE